ncbi:uncharacterized protein METZ01_LOCUS412940, partial [marine metagenome]
MLYVRKFTIVLLSAIFLTLISYSAQSVAADHVEPLDWTEFASQTGDGIYGNYGDVNIVPTRDSKY